MCFWFKPMLECQEYSFFNKGQWPLSLCNASVFWILQRNRGQRFLGNRKIIRRVWIVRSWAWCRYRFDRIYEIWLQSISILYRWQYPKLLRSNLLIITRRDILGERIGLWKMQNTVEVINYSGYYKTFIFILKYFF